MQLREYKKIAFGFGVSLFFVGIFFFTKPPQAHAVLGVGDVVSDPGAYVYFAVMEGDLSDIAVDTSDISANTTKQTTEQTTQDKWTQWWQTAQKSLLANLEKKAATAVVQQLTNSIVQWINNGFQGQPAFPDPQQFLSNVADQTIGNMIFNDPDLKQLCSPFQLQVQIALGFNYSGGANKMGCSLTSVVNNVTNAVNNASININADINQNTFTQQGGWENWLQTTTNPMNNAEGAFLVKKSEDDQKLADAQTAAQNELNRGQGSLTMAKCTNPDGSTYVGSPSFDATASYGVSINGKSVASQGTKSCQVQTPGAIITSQLGLAANTPGIEGALGSALGDGIDSIFSAIINQLASQVSKEISNGLLGGGDMSASNQQFLGNLDQLIASNTLSSLQVLSATDTLTSMQQSTDNALNSLGSDFSSSSGIDALFQGTIQTQQSSNPLNSLQVTDLANIANLINEETSYQNTYSQAAQVLTDADAIFKNARACNTSYASSTTALKAQLITDNIITNIEGTPDYARTTPTISWNLAAIQTDIAAENTKLSELAAAQQAVTDATDTPSTIAAMIPVSSGQFGLAPDQGLISNIQTWVKDIAPFYASSLCPIDVSSVVNATSTAN